MLAAESSVCICESKCHKKGGRRTHWARGGGQQGALPLATALTDVRLLPGVLADVSNQRTGLGEGLPTNETLTRLLT